MKSVMLEFYEKPGCINNRKQKALLTAAGFELNVHNLLIQTWQVDELRAYFEGLPLPQWFNPSAPRIKQERIKPFLMSEQEALIEMVKDPLLIRRPLIAYHGRRAAGFDLNIWLPLLEGAETQVPKAPENIEVCPRQGRDAGGCSQ